MEQPKCNPFVLQIGDQLFGVIFQHQTAANEIMHVVDIGACQQHQRGVLKRGGQDHDRLAALAIQQQVTAADSIMGAPRDDFVDHIRARAGLFEPDIEPCIPVIALGDGRIVAGKLELMMPLQL
ncbi:hypothetical protein CDAIGKPJ_02895 [Aeromonas salmonicida]